MMPHTDKLHPVWLTPSATAATLRRILPPLINPAFALLAHSHQPSGNRAKLVHLPSPINPA
jgi:hypothetical protein